MALVGCELTLLVGAEQVELELALVVLDLALVLDDAVALGFEGGSHFLGFLLAAAGEVPLGSIGERVGPALQVVLELADVLGGASLETLTDAGRHLA